MNTTFERQKKAQKFTFPFERETDASSPEVDCIIPSSHFPFGCLHQT